MYGFPDGWFERFFDSEMIQDDRKYILLALLLAIMVYAFVIAIGTSITKEFVDKEQDIDVFMYWAFFPVTLPYLIGCGFGKLIAWGIKKLKVYATKIKHRREHKKNMRRGEPIGDKPFRSAPVEHV